MLDPGVTGLPVELEHFDLSLERRRETGNAIVSEAAAAMREAGLGIKAATITPEGKDDVGSPNRILREEVDGKVIIRTGRRIPGAVGPVSGVHYPISVVRMAVGDAYGAEQWREGEEGSLGEVALRTERITRDVCRAVAEFSFRAAERGGARVYGGPKWTVSPVYEGMLKEEMDAAAERHPDVAYQPVLIDATYAGPDQRRRRRAARHPGAQPRRRLPLGPRDADVRLDRGRGVDPAVLRRGLRRRRRDGRGPARDRALAPGQGPRQPDGDDPRLRGGARAGRGQGRRRRGPGLARDLREHARGDRRRASRRSTSAARPPRPSSRTRWSSGSGRSSRSGRRWAPRRSRRAAACGAGRAAAGARARACRRRRSRRG